jgi:hypothetical protein
MVPSSTATSSIATNKPKLTAYVEMEINTAISREAKRERRSKSQMIELLIEEALKARGYQFATLTDADEI